MDAFAFIAAALVAAWAVLLVVAHQLNPEQSRLSMGMSGLARGRAPWVMKSAFLCRGASALALVIAVPNLLGTAGLTLAGILALWVWGVSSAALAVVDTDMPGEPPTQTGDVHAVVALLAAFCGVAGALVLSVALMRDDATAGVGAWALSLALSALVAMVLQFAAFGVATRDTRRARHGAPDSGAPLREAERPVVAAAGASGSAAVSPVAVTPVPPPLGAPGPLGAPQPSAAGRAAGASRGGARGFLSLDVLGRYAGLLQRIFVGLLMAWTLLVAVGIIRA